ncbi:MAG: RlpA-like double-psi beta-barrel domain-containing protein [bacterium]|nr:RlpA-like double-psi beta-barrel domain-containing protein [bacterium]
MKKNQFWQVLIISGLIFFTFNAVNAQTEAVAQNKSFFINLDEPTISKGYTVNAFDGALKLSLTPGILNEATGVDVAELHEPIDEPWSMDRVSEIYQFEFRNKSAYDNNIPFIIQMKYGGASTDMKQVYFFDKGFNAWRPLPTRDYVGENMVRAYIHLPFARIAVFSNPEIMGSGNASWYGYKSGNFAASPDFPKGSILRVWNYDNSKFVDVEVNDYGPDRALHPGRVIDLDKVAFEKLAPLGAGIINVSIEPLQITQDSGRIMGIKIDQIGLLPEVASVAAVVKDVDTDEIIYEKNIDQALPLASLTKLISASVFLDTNPDFEKIVAYKNIDEEITHAHVDKYEAARLRIADNDELKIKDLFYTSLMASTNNTVETLVRVSGLERGDFINKMNEKVHSWGATSTVFIEPTGLAPQNVSTVSNYVIISKEVLKDIRLLEVTTLKEYAFETIKEKKKFNIRNTNRLLADDFYITGGKTGYLDEAGYCLMTKAKFADRNLVAVLFGARTRDQSFNEVADLLRYAMRR